MFRLPKCSQTCLHRLSGSCSLELGEDMVNKGDGEREHESALLYVRKYHIERSTGAKTALALCTRAHLGGGLKPSQALDSSLSRSAYNMLTGFSLIGGGTVRGRCASGRAFTECGRLTVGELVFAERAHQRHPSPCTG